MAVPTQRHTKSRRNKRRMHIFLKTPVFVKCSKCGRAILPHQVCPHCGYYKGVEVIDVLKKLSEKEKKKKRKEMKLKKAEQAKEGRGPLSLSKLSRSS